MHRTTLQSGFHLSPGPIAGALAADSAAAAVAAAGLWHKDAATWSRDAGVQDKIANRLGWLTSPTLMASAIDRIKSAAHDIRRSGFEDVVLLGMGGSSLAPEVLRAVVGIAEGWPRLHMLDSTDPAAVRAVAIHPSRTLFLLASKSGTTIEPNSLAAHFRRLLEDASVPHWGDHFIAITDPDTELAARAVNEGFRDVFLNPPDIGGRYSALSYFGLVPAALMGQDIEALILWGQAMLDEAQSVEGATNPAVTLGLLMAAAARAGRDKLTLLLPASLEPFGLWVEQLVAESTGKQGLGVIPIAGETLGNRAVYGADRFFVRLRLATDKDEARRDAAVRALADAPIATIDFAEPHALGAEFTRWEIATAVAGALLGINPFDEPNVQQAKDATRALLGRYKAEGNLPVPQADSTDAGVTLTLTGAARGALPGGGAASILQLLRAGDYVALLAYLGPDPALQDVLHQFRMSVRDATRAATMFGYGPRYLHSTGQLHKGGPNSGLFVLVTATPQQDVAIPGEAFSFGTLELAQALGDFNALDAAGRRGVHIHLPSHDAQSLDRVFRTLVQHLPSQTDA